MLCPQGVPYTRYPSYQPTTRILRRKKLRLRAGRSEPCCRGLLDTASWHKTNQQTQYLGLVGDLLNDLTGVNLAGFPFHKRFFAERFRHMDSTSENQQVAVSIASGFLERLSGMASPSAGLERLNRYPVANARKAPSQGQCIMKERPLQNIEAG
jgi:hypothetical protein